MFHTFGDSHCFYGWTFSDIIKTHHCPGLLCYSFGKENIKRINISDKKYKVKNNDYILFSLGEIDCRCHVQKHITETNTYKNIIDNIIIEYFNSITINKNLFENLKICVFSVPPTIQRTKNKFKTYPEFPFLGTDEERKSYVLYFNQQLKIYCEKYDYIFIDVYNYYIDENGYMKYELSDKKVHIRNPYGIKNELKEKIKEISEFQQY